MHQLEDDQVTENSADSVSSTDWYRYSGFSENYTGGAKIIVDPEKSFQELISEKLLIFIAG